MPTTKTISDEYLLKSFAIYYHKDFRRPYNATVVWENMADEDRNIKIDKFFDTLDEARKLIKEETGIDL